MNRLVRCLDRLKQDNKKALATYFVNGDPNPDVCLEVMHALVESGADILEVGIPFSDPMAEGPVIQKGHERALVHGVSLKDSLQLVSQFRETNQDTPVILMGYANPVEKMGYQIFADSAAAAGVDGLLTVDLPPEEAEPLYSMLKEHGTESIFLLAPTSSEERIGKVAKVAGGFIYYVSLKGVTGAGNLQAESVSDQVRLIRKQSDLPILVGFGIKDAASAKAIGPLADGVVVGSALVDILGRQQDFNISIGELKEKVASIRQALDEL